ERDDGGAAPATRRARPGEVRERQRGRVAGRAGRTRRSPDDPRDVWRPRGGRVTLRPAHRAGALRDGGLRTVSRSAGDALSTCDAGSAEAAAETEVDARPVQGDPVESLVSLTNTQSSVTPFGARCFMKPN